MSSQRRVKRSRPTTTRNEETGTVCGAGTGTDSPTAFVLLGCNDEAVSVRECDFESDALVDTIHAIETTDGRPLQLAVHSSGDGVLCSFADSCKFFKVNPKGPWKLKASERELRRLQRMGIKACIRFSLDDSSLATGGKVLESIPVPDRVDLKVKMASKRKAVRVSERIANSRLRMQEGLLTPKVEAEISSAKTKLRRNKRIKWEEPSLRICTELCGKQEETETTTSDRDTEFSPALPADSTSSVELTPLAKRGKKQQLLVDINSPGARLSSGVEYIPPVSPYGLIQEHVYQNPWKVLVACMLLNKTGGRQVHKVIWDFFELCPDAEICISTETEKIGLVIHTLGLQNKRAKTLQRFSQDYLGTNWTNVTQLHGVGEYARDAYAIFCEGRWQDVRPNDIVLNKYWEWLGDTQGLGYGFSRIE